MVPQAAVLLALRRRRPCERVDFKCTHRGTSHYQGSDLTPDLNLVSHLSILQFPTSPCFVSCFIVSGICFDKVIPVHMQVVMCLGVCACLQLVFSAMSDSHASWADEPLIYSMHMHI